MRAKSENVKNTKVFIGQPLVFGGLFFDGGRRTSDKETSKVLRLPSENDIEKTRGFERRARWF